jgi:hypothetical protein
MIHLNEDDISRFLFIKKEIVRILEIMAECMAVTCQYDLIDIETSVDDFSYTLNYMSDGKECYYTHAMDAETILNYRQIMKQTKENYDFVQKTDNST